LTNAIIDSARQYNQCENTYEDLSLAFEKIEVASPVSGTSADDQWLAL
jgi:hypothetical protein